MRLKPGQAAQPAAQLNMDDELKILKEQA